ncbi:MAG: porin [Piscinibacter sp.]|uniref:porin n=1 Tax=Piscinibacter TaxID=1114981 RepID=UPI000FDEFA04|nr:MULTISPECIES: porin [Piscinibacter]MCW5663376.1 porin [Piscinibacter sp.]
MKRSLILAAVATLASGAALAQSSITIYGRLNASVERQKFETTDGETGLKTGSSIWALQNSSSRIGFKGTEDLGGGMKAFFVLEHGFNVDTGAQSSSTFWNRESTVGLSGAFGKVRLGNVGFGTAAYFATTDWVSMHNHDTGTSADAFYLYPAGPLRNMISYTTPSIGGFEAELQVGLKETTAAGSKNSVVLAGNYDAGSLHLGATYVNANGGMGSVSGDIKEFGLRGVYEFGPVTFGAYFINNKADGTGATAKRNSYRLAAMYTLGSSEFHVNVGKAGKIKYSGALTGEEPDATQATLGYNYILSKRTKVYAFYTALSGDGRELYSTNVGPAGFKNSFAVGMRHNF